MAEKYIVFVKKCKFVFKMQTLIHGHYISVSNTINYFAWKFTADFFFMATLLNKLR